MEEVDNLLNLLLLLSTDSLRVDEEEYVATDVLYLWLSLRLLYGSYLLLYWCWSWCRSFLNRLRLLALCMALAKIDAHTSQSIEIPVGIACLL